MHFVFFLKPGACIVQLMPRILMQYVLICLALHVTRVTAAAVHRPARHTF